MSMFEEIYAQDPVVKAIIEGERQRQKDYINLIASENFASRPVMLAQASCLANKYAEGYPGKRYYGGCAYVDQAEVLAIERAKELFKADFVNVQPHSGAQANCAVYQALLEPGDAILGMSLTHGGHLTHGFKVNSSGKNYRAFFYGVDTQTYGLDYEEMERVARAEKPKLIIAGFSAYSGTIDWARFRAIADEVGAYLLADMAHIAGLVAAGVTASPLPYADVVTCTTHKTLRGPRGGLIMSSGHSDIIKKLQSGVFPGTQGGPMMHTILAKAIAFGEALKPEFKAYQSQVIKNAQVLASRLSEHGYQLLDDHPRNHMVLVDLRERDYTGAQAEQALEKAQIIANKNTIPGDTRSAFETSGLRFGTPAMTTRGLQESEMIEIADLIHAVLNDINSKQVIEDVAQKVTQLCGQFPIEV